MHALAVDSLVRRRGPIGVGRTHRARHEEPHHVGLELRHVDYTREQDVCGVAILPDVLQALGIGGGQHPAQLLDARGRRVRQAPQVDKRVRRAVVLEREYGQDALVDEVADRVRVGRPAESHGHGRYRVGAKEDGLAGHWMYGTHVARQVDGLGLGSFVRRRRVVVGTGARRGGQVAEPSPHRSQTLLHHVNLADELVPIAFGGRPWPGWRRCS